MFKCKDCGHVFDEPSIYEENGENWRVCPLCCKEDISEVTCCKECGEHFAEDDDFYGGYCWDCAICEIFKDIHRAVDYLHYAGLERDFFLGCIWDIKVYYTETAGLIEILRNEFIKQVEDSGLFSNRRHNLNQLEATIMDDWTQWVDFLSKPSVHVKTVTLGLDLKEGA